MPKKSRNCGTCNQFLCICKLLEWEKTNKNSEENENLQQNIAETRNISKSAPKPKKSRLCEVCHEFLCICKLLEYEANQAKDTIEVDKEKSLEKSPENVAKNTSKSAAKPKKSRFCETCHKFLCICKLLEYEAQQAKDAMEVDNQIQKSLEKSPENVAENTEHFATNSKEIEKPKKKRPDLQFCDICLVLQELCICQAVLDYENYGFEEDLKNGFFEGKAQNCGTCNEYLCICKLLAYEKTISENFPQNVAESWNISKKNDSNQNETNLDENEAIDNSQGIHFPKFLTL